MEELNTVVEQLMDSAPDDAAQGLSEQEGLQEVTRDEAQSAPEMLGDSAEQDEGEARQDAHWFKHRIAKAVDKAVAEAEARLKSHYEQELAVFREERLTRQAQALVDDGEFKSLERAKEYLALKSGAPRADEAREQAEKPSGEQSAPDPAIAERARILSAQAQKIASRSGLDVMAAYNADLEIQRKVASGEWDFYDVAESLKPPAPPSPARTPNGASVKRRSISQMTSEEFRRLDAELAAGKTFR